MARTRETIDACAEAGFPSVIGFVGYKWPKSGQSRTAAKFHSKKGIESCVTGLKEIAGHAESEEGQHLHRAP